MPRASSSRSPKSKQSKKPPAHNQKRFVFISAVYACSAFLVLLGVLSFSNIFSVQYSRADYQASSTVANTVNGTAPQGGGVPPPGVTAAPTTQFDIALYDEKILANANIRSASSTAKTASTSAASTTHHLWPVKTTYPNAGALLPFHRIIAYYGNFYSTKMGVLGQYPPAIMIPKLQAEVAKWNAADPSTPAIPAIDYIAVTAQGSPGADGKYRFRMPDSQIQQALALADQTHGIVILDVQVGLSNVQTEVPLLEKYLKLPNVHLALDPEFSMKSGAKPGTVIGTMDASDFNFAANYLANLVRQNNLPPKILVLHRFTQAMITRYKLIKPLPEVQMVMDMDGWGSPAKKLNTYQQFVYGEPVQFTGFKLFYKNDLKPPSTRILTPSELLKLSPRPLFIQFQ
jgi:hypothetical protein